MKLSSQSVLPEYAHVRVYFRVICLTCGKQADGSQARQPLFRWVEIIKKLGWRVSHEGYSCPECSAILFDE